jgi:hypothetical protein
MNVKSAGPPLTLVSRFSEAGLGGHIDPNLTTHVFWEGAELNNDAWREEHMQSPPSSVIKAAQKHTPNDGTLQWMMTYLRSICQPPAAIGNRPRNNQEQGTVTHQIKDEPEPAALAHNSTPLARRQQIQRDIPQPSVSTTTSEADLAAKAFAEALRTRVPVEAVDAVSTNPQNHNGLFQRHQPFPIYQDTTWEVDELRAENAWLLHTVSQLQRELDSLRQRIGQPEEESRMPDVQDQVNGLYSTNSHTTSAAAELLESKMSDVVGVPSAVIAPAKRAREEHGLAVQDQVVRWTRSPTPRGLVVDDGT